MSKKKFLNLEQGRNHEIFRERARWWPTISSNICNIRCTVNAHLIPSDISQELLFCWNNNPSQIIRKFSFSFQANFILNYNPLLCRWRNSHNPFRIPDSRFQIPDSDSDSNSNSNSDSDSDSDSNMDNQQIQEKQVDRLEVALKLSISDQCSICLESMDVNNINWWTSCGHICCTECQIGMKNSGRTIKCQLCRALITEKVGVPIKII